jgi:Secretion system C-terminal sorting domain/Right handed beta helix region
MKNFLQQTKQWLIIALSLCLSNTYAQTYYVDALNGSNNFTGTSPSQAWSTLQKAVSSVGAGATVIIAGGTYFGKVTIPATANGVMGAPTIFKNKDGETPIIDGLNTGTMWEGLLTLNQNQFITIKGLKTQNGYWYGFNVVNSNNIIIDGCASINTRASGIYANSCSALTITNNDIRKACQFTGRDANGNGTQECITVTGSNNFKVTKNEVWDSTVPGTAGGEGIDVKGSSFNGEVSANYIHDIVPLGIYIDAGSGEEHTIRVFNNKVYRTGGLGVAGELGGHARDIYIYNNVVASSKASGIVFQETGNGKFTNVFVVNNTFYNSANGTSFAGDVGSYTKNAASTNIVIKNNIFYNKIANYRFTIWHNTPAAHVISNNLYFDFKASANSSLSFTASNLTTADVQADPKFNNIAIEDYSLLPTSPAINKGVPVNLPNSATPLFTTDFNGNPKGTTWDMGAYEYTARVGVFDVNNAEKLTIYPNPARDYVVLEQIRSEANIELYDVLGQKILTQKSIGGTVNIDISSFNKGIYLVKIINKDNVLQVGKFVKE